jgi:hypothetical protein
MCLRELILCPVEAALGCPAKPLHRFYFIANDAGPAQVIVGCVVL